MPRPLRIHAPGAFYHVTLRSNHRQNIFFSTGDRRLLDDITAEVLERFRILGSDDFAAKLLGEAWRPRSRTTFDELIDEACRQFDVSASALYSLSAQRHLTHARAWVAHQALTLRISSLTAVARRFNRTEGALRQSVKRHFNYP